jgi:hypothetical protein
MIKYLIESEYASSIDLVVDIKNTYNKVNKSSFIGSLTEFENNMECNKLLYIYFSISEEPSYNEFKSILRELFGTHSGMIFGDSLCDNNIIPLNKKSPEWKNIPFCKENLGRKSLYWQYKEKWNVCCKDFGKYFKTYGLSVVSQKWRSKFKHLKPLYNYYWAKPLPIDSGMFNVFKSVYKKEIERDAKNKKELYWPFATSIINDGKVREDPDYILVSASDILKIDYLRSRILCDTNVQKFLSNVALSFMKYTYTQAKEMKTVLSNKKEEYKHLLEMAVKKKRRSYK